MCFATQMQPHYHSWWPADSCRKAVNDQKVVICYDVYDVNSTSDISWWMTSFAAFTAFLVITSVAKFHWDKSLHATQV